MRFTVQKALSVILAGLMISSTGLFALADTNAPALPKEFQAKQAGVKATLIEFSAPWCGSCQKLKPYMEAIRKEAGTKLHVVELNIEKPETEKYMKLYNLVSAPTYVLYNAQGKATQKIERDITPTELKTIISGAIK